MIPLPQLAQRMNYWRGFRPSGDLTPTPSRMSLTAGTSIVRTTELPSTPQCAHRTPVGNAGMRGTERQRRKLDRFVALWTNTVVDNSVRRNIRLVWLTTRHTQEDLQF